MKPGSLVECIKSISISDAMPTYRPYIKRLPIKGKIYTVREIAQDKDDDPVIYLEEVLIGIGSAGQELGLGVNCYREVIIPPAIEEEIQEMLTKELELV